MTKNEVIITLGKNISKNILKQADRIIEPGEGLISTGVIDSFSLVDLALMIEDIFGVRIEDYELNSDSFDNLDQLAEIILARI